MKVTKQQKILGGVMLVGLLLVGADHFGMLPGASASDSQEATSEYAMASAPAAATPPAVAATPAPAAQGASVAQRLREAGRTIPQEQLRDVFSPGPAWIAPAAEAPAVDLTAQAVEQFKQSHKLTGVLSASGRDHATIDNKIVAIGQTVDGFKLVSVSHRSATFQSGNARIVLNMGVPSGAAVAGAQ